MPRLLIDSIDSVGLVPEGDNPESMIVFYKRRPDTSTGASISDDRDRQHRKRVTMTTQKERTWADIEAAAVDKIALGPYCTQPGNSGKHPAVLRTEIRQSAAYQPIEKFLAKFRDLPANDVTIRKARGEHSKALILLQKWRDGRLS